MTVTAASFRAAFPAFANSAEYPDAQVNFYVGFAVKMLRPERWGDVLDEGTSLFVAHMLAVEKLGAGSQGGVPGAPGSGVGVLTGGTVDKVSFTKSIEGIMEEGAGHWNMTTYGLQFIRMARMMGTGPLQIGMPYDADGFGTLYNGAWPGVILGPW